MIPLYEQAAQADRVFSEIGMLPGDAELFRTWVYNGAFRLNATQQKRYAEMFERLRSCAPKESGAIPPSNILLHRGISFKESAHRKPLIALMNKQVFLQSRILCSWTSNEQRAISYACTNLLGVVVSAKSKSVGLLDLDAVQDFLKIRRDVGGRKQNEIIGTFDTGIKMTYTVLLEGEEMSPREAWNRLGLKPEV